MQLLSFCLVKEVGGLLQRAAESCFAEVIGASLEQSGGELTVQRTGNCRDILVKELLLEVDGVGGDDCLAVMLQRKTDARYEVGERFAYTCTGFCQQSRIRFQCAGYGTGHFLLLRTELEATGSGKNARG